MPGTKKQEDARLKKHRDRLKQDEWERLKKHEEHRKHARELIKEMQERTSYLDWKDDEDL